MALIVGIDPSAGKIAAVAQEGLTRIFVVRAAKLYPKGTTKQSPASLAAALDFMSDLLQAVEGVGSEGQRFAYIEEPLVGRGGASATIKQAYVGGVIRACLAQAGFKVYDAHPSRWRSALGIKVPRSVPGGSARTKALKEETRKAVAARWPKVIGSLADDSDLTDAAAICLYGAEQVRKGARFVPSEPSGGAV